MEESVLGGGLMAPKSRGAGIAVGSGAGFSSWCHDCRGDGVVGPGP